MTEDITILIVEDNRGHYILATHCLKNAGIENEVLWFSNGQEILDFLLLMGTEHGWDPGRKYLVLLDISLPKVDGFKVLETLRNSANNIKDTPVIVISTSNIPSQVDRCKELGCTAYIVKPLEEDFIEAVQNSLQYI